jgi:hypothetical protein
VGCDYVATATPLSAAWTSWANIAIIPVSTYGLGHTTLSDFSRTYSEYRIDRIMACFIPSIGTTSSGQIALYHLPQRSDPAVDPNSNAFLPYVLNQRSGAVGPVWQPLNVEFPTSGKWFSTVPLDGTDPDDEVEMEIYASTSNFAAAGVAPSIGIFKLMYSVSFRGMARNPRSGLIPLDNNIARPTCLGVIGISAVAGTSLTLNVIGTDQSGQNAVVPPGNQNGDVYKVVVDVSRSTFGVPSGAVIFGINFLGTVQVFPFQGTVTVYGILSGTNWNLFSTFNNAMTQSNPLVYAVGVTTNTINLRCFISLVGAMGARTLTTLV